ncbi:hypothetical protein U1Q18_005976 [Sarracenia purpurea var. burkii]
MAISKALVSSALLISLLIFHFVEPNQMIAAALAPPGVPSHRGRTSATGRAELAASAATACRQALPGTKTSVPATPT